MQTPYIAVDHFILFVFTFEFADFRVNRSIRVTVHTRHVLIVDFGCSTQDGHFVRNQRSERLIACRLGLMLGPHTKESSNQHDGETDERLCHQLIGRDGMLLRFSFVARHLNRPRPRPTGRILLEPGVRSPQRPVHSRSRPSSRPRVMPRIAPLRIGCICGRADPRRHHMRRCGTSRIFHHSVGRRHWPRTLISSLCPSPGFPALLREAFPASCRIDFRWALCRGRSCISAPRHIHALARAPSRTHTSQITESRT